MNKMVQKNFKRCKTYVNIKTGKRVKVIAIGDKTAISCGYKKFISSKNLKEVKK